MQYFVFNNKNTMKTRRMTPEQAFKLFDSLEPVTMEELVEVGTWRGAEIITGHPMDGLLTAASWYGKKFEPDGGIHPLLFKGANGKIYSGDVAKFPLKAFISFPRPLIKILFFFFSPLIHTKKACTQYWNVEYRGKRTAAMVYDKLPIVEIFVRMDSNTLLGATVSKWGPPSSVYFFTISKP